MDCIVGSPHADIIYILPIAAKKAAKDNSNNLMHYHALDICAKELQKKFCYQNIFNLHDIASEIWNENENKTAFFIKKATKECLSGIKDNNDKCFEAAKVYVSLAMK